MTEPLPITEAPREFREIRNFPGTHDNEFDAVLNRVENLQRMPLPLFLLLLAALAVLPTWGRWEQFALLWGAMVLDYALLALLPLAHRSYGPPKPPALILALLRLPFALLPAPWMGLVQLLGTLLVLWGFWVEPHRITVTRKALQSPKLRADQPPLRILHLADLHVERITAREKQLTRLVDDLKPDVIVFSGDVLNLSYLHDAQAQTDARAVMRAWQAPGGTFAVSGSTAVDLTEGFGGLMDGLPLRWLNDEIVTVTAHGQTLQIIGLTCTHKPFIDAPRLQSLADKAASKPFTLLLYHTPDLAPHAAQSGKIDLQVSGHTHGGQVRLPFYGALYAGLLYGKRFEAGAYRLGRMLLYVSRGIGMEGKAAPRVRFLCPPEVILWEVSGE